MALAVIVTASAPAGERVRAGSRRGDGLGILVVAEALAWRGAPYLYGGTTRGGVDCSGFVSAVLTAAAACADPPRRSSAFANFGLPVDGPVEPGDILLFGKGGRVDHVGIALSERAFIHSVSEGPTTGVIISSLDDESWRSRLIAVRRMEG